MTDVLLQPPGNGPAPPQPAKTLRRRVYEILEGAHEDDRHSQWFDRLLVLLILLNVAAFIAETVPSLRHDYGFWFDHFETFSVSPAIIERIVSPQLNGNAADWVALIRDAPRNARA